MSPSGLPPKTLPGSVWRFSERLGDLKDHHRGQNGIPGDPANYIPLSELEKLFPLYEINSILEAYNPPLSYNSTAIRKRFLRVFSLLIIIGRVEALGQFFTDELEDAKLPLTTIPARWAKTPVNVDLFNDVKNSQWIFFPFMFDPDDMYNPKLDVRRVLPITTKEIFRQGSDDAEVSKIQVHPFYRPRRDSTLIRKTYTGDRVHRFFDRERKAFNSLRSQPSDNIILCYGSFTQVQIDGTEVCNLLLEYADGGDLDAFFKTTLPPTTREDVHLFWKSMRGAFQGLHHLHDCRTDPDDHGEGHRIVHQDLKPGNLLLVQGPTGSKYDFTLKLADFGFSNMKLKSPNSDDDDVIDSHGGQTYGAPECSHHEKWKVQGKSHVTPAADIWSMGCIMSEAACWMVLGPPGLQEYHRRRCEQTMEIGTFKGSGHGGCFHDGIERLQSVDSMHEDLREQIQPFDIFTSRVLKLVDDHMLIRQEDGRGRYKPYEVAERLSRLLESEGHSKHPSISSPASNQESPFDTKNIPHTTSPALGSPIPFNLTTAKPTNSFPLADSAPKPNDFGLTYEMALKYYRARKGDGVVDPGVERMVNQLRASLGDRDHLFFIDTSPSMKEHYTNICQSFQVLAYLAKLIDTNGIEVCFSAEPKKIYEHSHTTPLLARLKEQKWLQRTFEDRLNTFIRDKVFSRLPSRYASHIPGNLFNKKRLSIFIFTDGRWGNDWHAACGIENPIKMLLDKISTKGLDRTQIMIQLIRFGNDEAGIRHLTYLDHIGKHYLKEGGKEGNYDVIDTKPFNSNVDVMLYGSVNQEADIMDEERDTPLSAESHKSAGFQWTP